MRINMHLQHFTWLVAKEVTRILRSRRLGDQLGGDLKRHNWVLDGRADRWWWYSKHMHTHTLYTRYFYTYTDCVWLCILHMYNCSILIHHHCNPRCFKVGWPGTKHWWLLEPHYGSFPGCWGQAIGFPMCFLWLMNDFMQLGCVLESRMPQNAWWHRNMGM